MLSKTVALSPEVTELALQLRRRGVADVLDATDLTRALYSSDASLYRVLPQAVVQPRTGGKWQLSWTRPGPSGCR